MRRSSSQASSAGSTVAAKADADAALRPAVEPDVRPDGRAEARPGQSSESPRHDDAYRVVLPAFEGPLDLLLHLIQQHELDIMDIPVSFVTERYLAYLQLMDQLAIDIASEYLVMAATLVHIKSKMLLPVVPKGQEDDGVPEDEVDPREELVRRLLEYQKFKNAAGELAARATLGRDVFARGEPEAAPDAPAEFAPVGVFALMAAFEKLLQRSNIPFEHEVAYDRLTINERIIEITDLLKVRRRIAFSSLFAERSSHFDLILTFLALLEMAKMRLVDLYQTDPLAEIHLELSVAETADGSQPEIPEPPEAREETEKADVAEAAEAAEDVETPEEVDASENVEAPEEVEASDA